MPTSGDTILRTLKRTMAAYEAAHPCASPCDIGIDDWAYRRGYHYGTIIIDLERRQPIALLPDREAATVAAWLAQHPNIRVVTRDRAGAYADAVRQGAPQAMQVADRWHLLKNLGEAMERLLTRFQHAVRETAGKLLEQQEPAPCPNTDTAALFGKETALSLQHRARRLACYENVVRLHQQGLSISAIARAQQLDRKTVRAWLQGGRFPERAPRPPIPGKLQRYRAYLQERWNAGCHNGSALLRELKLQGYRGGASLLRKLLAQWRHALPAMPASVGASPPSPCCIRAWLLGTAYRSGHDAQYRTRFVESLCHAYPQIDTFRRLGNEFAAMLRERRQAGFEGWLRQARATGIVELCRFAEGLERDAEAVHAAMATPYSNGMVEGHINRLKMLKRQMYGRASFALLRIRVLHRQATASSVT
jgi:transposase